MTQLELAHKLGVGTTSVYNWCNGIKSPRMDKVDKMCSILGCLRSDFMEEKSEINTPTKQGIVINVLGRVTAGIPIEAIEDVIDTEEITQELARTGSFFGLQIKGDSMIPEFKSGDTVIVRQQPDADSDDVVIASVNGSDATCKRLKKYKDGIALIPTNPTYEPIRYTNEEIESIPVRIIGRVMENRRKY